jgi:hypothetical protein
MFDNFHLLVCMPVAERRLDAGSGFKRRSVCIYVDSIFCMSSLLYVASRRPLWRCVSRARPVVQAQCHTVTHLLTKGWQPAGGVAEVTVRHFKEVIKRRETSHMPMLLVSGCPDAWFLFSSWFSETESLGTAAGCLLPLTLSVPN